MNKVHFNTVSNCTKYLVIRTLKLFFLELTKKRLVSQDESILKHTEVHLLFCTEVLP